MLKETSCTPKPNGSKLIIPAIFETMKASAKKELKGTLKIKATANKTAIFMSSHAKLRINAINKSK